MKRIVALFLAVTLLIGVLGTAAAAVEITATPEIIAPTVKSATIDADGFITVVPGDTDFQDGQRCVVTVDLDGYLQNCILSYNTEKKAFIIDEEYYYYNSEEYNKEQIKGGTIEKIELARPTYKSETTGKTNVDTNTYSYFFYNKDLKLIQSWVAQYKYIYLDGEILKEEYEGKFEYYDVEGKFITQKSKGSSVTDYNKDGSVKKEIDEDTYYNKDGIYDHSNKRTSEYTYDKEYDLVKDITVNESVNKDGKVTDTDKTTRTYTYNQEKTERTITEKGESTSNNEYGVLIATEKTSSTEKEKRDEYGSYWVGVESSTDKIRLNKDGKVVYTSTSSQKDGVSKTDERSYDEFGVLYSGYTSTSEQLKYHYESFDRFGKTYESTTEYEAIKDAEGKVIDSGYWIGTTEISYYNYKGGVNVKSSESVTKPEYKKLENGGTRTLRHQVSTEYDKYGAETSTSTLDEIYDEIKDEIIQKTVTVNYVGKPVTAEMHDKVERICIRKQGAYIASGNNTLYGNNTSIYYNSDYNNSDYTNTTTYYDWDGSVERKEVQSRNTTTDDNGYSTTTTIDATYSDDGKTIEYGNKTVSGTDKNGRYFYTYDNTNWDGSTYANEYRYEEKTGWTDITTGTNSEGWSYVRRSDNNGIVTTYYDADKKEYGKLTENIETRNNGIIVSSSDRYTDAAGKTVYEIRRNYKDGNYTDITYLDANGKELGFSRGKSGYNDDYTVYTSTTEYKRPVFDTHEFALTGAWNEYSYEYTWIPGNDGKSTTKSTTIRKNYNKDGILTRESEEKNNNGEYSGSIKEYTAKGVLRYTSTNNKEGNVTTYYDNPGNTLSKVINRPADKTKAVSDTSNSTVITETVWNDVTYYNLDGKVDRQYVDKSTYEYDDDYSRTKAIETEEYRDASGKAVVTRTTTTDYTDGYKEESETKTKDGKVIGYSRSSEKDNVATSERLTANFNSYTGYVFNSTLIKETRNTKDDTYTSTQQKLNHDGEVTYSYERNLDKDDNTKTIEKGYKTFEDGSLRPDYETKSSYDAKTKKNESETVYFRWSGAKLRSSKSESAYDPEKDLTVGKTEYYNSDDELVYTAETNSQEKAYGEWGTRSVSQTVYTDAKGNEIGYRKVSEDGAVESKTPNTSASGNLTGAYTLSTTSADKKVTTSKSYDKNGLLTSERKSDGNAFTNSTKSYWEGSSTVKSSTESSEDSTGMKTTVTANYGEAGDLRSKVETVAGRKSGTHFYTETEKHYNNAGALVYTYERVTDYQKDETTGVYKDASGKEIGHDRIDKEDGSWSIKTPDGTYTRTGEISRYYEYGRDENGFWYDVTYDKNGKETWRYTENLDEDGNTISACFIDGSKTPAYYTVYDGNMSTTYDASGEMLRAMAEQWYSNGIAQYGIEYYNQKGELVYTELYDVSDGYYSRGVYLDADGKVIAERDVNKDNGDYSSKYPYTTYANNITGYREEESKDNGKTRIEREYNKDNELIGERVRTTATTQTDDTITRTVTDGSNRKISVSEYELDQDNEYTRATVTSFSRWNGAVTGVRKNYYEEDMTLTKDYDENGNLTQYGYEWSEDDWLYNDYYWVNGNQARYYWSDQLEEQGYYNSEYYANGMISYESYNNNDGHSYYRNYNEDGKLTYNSETIDGVTNITWYDADGNVTGYDWGRTSTWVGKNITDSTVWDAEKIIYNKHTEDDPEGGTITTWKDPAGNVKVIKNEGTTVTFASPADGWQQAFGNEWYYLEGGKPVTGWKMLGGNWYYFYDSGEMATGLVKDGDSLYGMRADGAWTASGWNQDSNGSWEYIENGTAVTGWKQIGDKWYYFTNGWYVNDNPYYDGDVGWYQSGEGYMVTGAFDVWNSDWTDTTTYFFNKDGSWDTTAGWKNDGINWYYFANGGDRAIGWKQIGGEWYYFNAKGIMSNGWVGGSGAWYYLNEDGTMADGEWIQERFEDDWYYADKGGLMATGWRDINGNWYYFNNSGDMASEQWVKSGDDWYYMTESGSMATGWTKDDDNWYYMDEGGAMKTGWVQDGNTWYYLNASGEMVTGQQTIDGVVSNFDENGAWIGYAE